VVVAPAPRGCGVTVNAVAPGPTATPLFLEGKDDETIDHLKGMSPLERLGEPEDIAEVVAFLAGPGRWINGQTIFTNGGVA
jgi:3-oxoacyl-[acyl-carrier protein] reductase